MTPENQRDEEEVIKEAKKHSQELPPHKASQKYRINSLLKIILDYQEQRQSWERELEATKDYARQLADKGIALEKEKAGLEERVRECPGAMPGV